MESLLFKMMVGWAIFSRQCSDHWFSRRP